MSDATATSLQSEFAPLIIERFEVGYSQGRRMSEPAQENLVYRPLADLEAEFPSEILRDALVHTLARVDFGPTRRWHAYTRAIARTLQQRAAA